MKAIKTTYRGATNTRGARILASDGDGNRVSVPYRHELSGAAVHAVAAQRLAKKMNWTPCEMIAGGIDGGYCFVFAESDRFTFSVGGITAIPA